MTREALEALAARCEQATGPDTTLDTDIWEAFGRPNEYLVRDLKLDPPDYTASVDAALTLVPEGWWLQHVGWCLNGWRARVETNGPPSESIGVGFGNVQPVKTPALAITAAALRAHAAKEGE